MEEEGEVGHLKGEGQGEEMDMTQDVDSVGKRTHNGECSDAQ